MRMLTYVSRIHLERLIMIMMNLERLIMIMMNLERISNESRRSYNDYDESRMNLE
jgi:hypothetical protein